jgi:hypothetical protein
MRAFYSVWFTKWGKPFFSDPQVKGEFKRLLTTQLEGLKIPLDSLEVHPQYVLLSIKANYPPSLELGIAKGFISFVLRKRFPSLRKAAPSFWADRNILSATRPSIKNIQRRVAREETKDPLKRLFKS